jgi:hypothetical protein
MCHVVVVLMFARGSKCISGVLKTGDDRAESDSKSETSNQSALVVRFELKGVR